jgi:hypothetical protein
MVLVVTAVGLDTFLTVRTFQVETAALEDPACCGIRLYVEPGNEVAIRTYHSVGLGDAPYRMLELDFTEPERHES